MPKIRGIKPEFWTDEKVVEVSALARLLFIGMWNYACDNGHLEDRPKQIKLRVLPADDADAGSLIEELGTAKLVVREGGWITIPTLRDHQKPDKRWFLTCDFPGCSDAKPVVRTKREAPPEPEGAPPDPQRDHDVPPTWPPRAPRVATESHCTEGDGDVDVEGDVDKRTRSSDADAPDDRPRIEDDFTNWWHHYPRKVSKGQALKAYKAARKKTDHATLVGALVAQLPKLTAQDKQFQPHASTWLNGERWEDDDTPTPTDDGWREPATPPAWLLDPDGTPDHG